MVLPKAKLVLENGAVFEGYALGDIHLLDKACAEVVFNTAMSGYQEILTDPSYAEQIITLTYPHIGNVGSNDEDCESTKIFAKGLIIRELPLVVSNWRSQQNLDDFLKAHKTVALAGIDTRALTNTLREHGALRGCIADANTDTKTALLYAQQAKSLTNLDLAHAVSTTKSYVFNEGSFNLNTSKRNTANATNTTYNVAVYDFGIKRNILNILVDRGCKLTVYPAKTPAAKILKTKPDGVFLSNGPGDPEPCSYAIESIKTLLKEDVPLFGICLGHQLLSLACGASTEKMKFGHHGANHPVQDLRSKRVMITSQNHGFTVSDNTLPERLIITHRSLFDNSIQGMRVKGKKAFAFQGHPEASPGPHDMDYLFDEFTELMQ